jgi:hypothetical protein
MSIDVELTDDGWNEYVERARWTGPFHRTEALETIADHAGATLYPLVGFKGQEPVGLFPAFEVSRGPVTATFSPPPDLRVPYLGPAVLNMEKLKRRKADRRLRRFVEGSLEWLRAEISPWYLNVRTAHGYGDVRPFQWADCEVTPRHTYVVDLSGDREELLMAFSSDARRNVRDGRDAEYFDVRASADGSDHLRDPTPLGEDDGSSVAERGPEAIDRIVEQVRNRYESQGIQFGVSAAFVRDLYDRLPDGHVRPYTCRVDGEFVGGILAMEAGDAVYRWQGGVRTDADVDVAVNDLLDWAVMRDAAVRDLAAYDLVGADDPRISRYKSKFAPELSPFYSIEGGTRPARIAASLYQRVRK